MKGLRGKRVFFLGNALVVVKIYPNEPKDALAVEKGVRAIKSGSVKDVRREPVAFGLEIVRAGIVVPDKTEGAMEALETELRKIKGAKEFEIEGVTLL